MGNNSNFILDSRLISHALLVSNVCKNIVHFINSVYYQHLFSIQQNAICSVDVC